MKKSERRWIRNPQEGVKRDEKAARKKSGIKKRER
jgi:hypothetical protein